MNQLSASPAIISGADRIGTAAVEAASAKLGESATLRARRLAAWNEFGTLPMPTNRDEDWRRTDIRSLDLGAASLDSIGAAAGLPEDVASLLADADSYAGRLALGSSVTGERYLDPALAKQGVVFSDLASAVREHPALLEKHLMTSAVKIAGDKFTALHGALWTNGSLLYVPKGVRIELPIRSTFIARAGESVFPHTLIVAEPESEVSFVDVYVSASAEAGATPVASGAVEIIARPGARVRYASVQVWAGDVWGFNAHHSLVERDATVDSLHIALGGRLSRAIVRTSLVDSGASARMLGLVLGGDHQLFDHHTYQDHLAPRTTSDLLYKSALKDQSRSVFAGLIRAGRDAQKTDAVQTSRNLLLNAKARADAIPMLEIEANDLRCTHAATVAPVDEEQLFYLRSRGLSRTEAQQMIVEGFVTPVIAELPAAGLRDALSAFVAAKVAAF